MYSLGVDDLDISNKTENSTDSFEDFAQDLAENVTIESGHPVIEGFQLRTSAPLELKQVYNASGNDLSQYFLESWNDHSLNTRLNILFGLMY